MNRLVICALEFSKNEGVGVLPTPSFFESFSPGFLITKHFRRRRSEEEKREVWQMRICYTSKGEALLHTYFLCAENSEVLL